MGNTHKPYPEEFRRQMVELVRAGRNPYDLAGASSPRPEAQRESPGPNLHFKMGEQSLKRYRRTSKNDFKRRNHQRPARKTADR